MYPLRITFEKKSTKTPRNFKGNIWSGFFSFFKPKQQPRPQSNIKKLVFCLPPITIRCAGDEVGQKAVCFIYSKNLKLYGKGL